VECATIDATTVCASTRSAASWCASTFGICVGSYPPNLAAIGPLAPQPKGDPDQDGGSGSQPIRSATEPHFAHECRLRDPQGISLFLLRGRYGAPGSRPRHHPAVVPSIRLDPHDPSSVGPDRCRFFPSLSIASFSQDARVQLLRSLPFAIRLNT
jgi:hypothetical protein